MTKKIKIQERRPPIWKMMAAISAVVCLFFAIFFILSNSTLGAGIYRLIAFASLAILVISLLQQRGKTDYITLNVTPPDLIVTYFLSGKKNQEEVFKLNTIKNIQGSPAPPLWNIFPRKDCITFVIAFTDTDNTISLLRFGGRVLFLSPRQARKVDSFVAENLDMPPLS